MVVTGWSNNLPDASCKQTHRFLVVSQEASAVATGWATTGSIWRIGGVPVGRWVARAFFGLVIGFSGLVGNFLVESFSPAGSVNYSNSM